MNINRRQLLCLLLVRPRQSTSLQVSVLEVFSIDDKTLAILVNHANESSRNRFAQWLQTNPKAKVRIRGTTSEGTDATIFRVRMCFGRGLILLSQPITIREGEVLTLST
jgi:hypothetical protein